jgi:hypothetical protein
MLTTAQDTSVHLPLLRDMFPHTLNLSVADAARVIGWAPGSLRNAISKHTAPLRCTQVGRRRMVPVIEVARFLDERLAASARAHMGRPRKSGGAS